MKKLLLALTLVLCLAVSMVALTSCGGTGEDGCEHTWATEATVDTAATCTEEGVATIKCTACGEKKADSETVVPATGHAYDAETTVDPTCTEEGSVTKTCTACGDVKTETIPATGSHIWQANPSVDVLPTCTTEGQKSIKCIMCQSVKDGSVEVIPATHDWAAEATVDVAPTCTTDGQKSTKCLFCGETKPDSTEVVPATGHKGVAVITVPTLFSEGYEKGTCTVCNEYVDRPLAKTTADVITVTTATKDEHLVKEGERLGDVLADGQHFYPTEDNPNGNSLYIEFSILLNGTMDNLVGTNISFPGIYTDSSLSSQRGHSAFWFYIKNADGIAKGKCDDWTSNAVDKNNPDMYYNNQPALAFDGWHRIAVEFHQNDNIDYDNFEVTSTMTVTMYYDGVKVYEATLGNGTKPAEQELLLYTATFEGDEVVYTDCVDSYAAYMSYNAYVTDAANPAYIITADKYVTCGNDGFVLDVTPVTNPEAGEFTQDDITLSAKAYYELAQDDTDSEDAGTTTPGGSTDSEDAETTTPTNPGFGSASDSEDSENAGTTTPANPGFGSASDSEDAG